MLRRVRSTTDLGEALDRRVRALNRLVRAHTDYGLSITAASVLSRLTDGPQRVTELASAEAVAQPSMTALVGRLEARGLVTRTRDQADARAVLVALTDEGRERLLDARRRRAEVLAERLRALDPDVRAAIAAALPLLDQLLDEGPQ
ncbi:MAG: MarR family transcriptional regulator [Solirubrobacterales bacterium]|nr:MarR family transcriptional regulator [Solirubrobacterales bacterium]